MDMAGWIERYQRQALETFGGRICFMGVQGSRARGEAREESDIDMVLILDEVDGKDLLAYRAMLQSLEHGELACGFISGREVLKSWPRWELFQFYRDTRPLYGTLDFLLPLIGPRDIAEAVKNGAANVYHAACHSLVFGQGPGDVREVAKGAFFVLQAKCYLEQGQYWGSRAALMEHLAEEDKALLQTEQLEREEALGRLAAWSGALLTKWKDKNIEK